MCINNCMGEQISNYNHLAPTGFRLTISREFYPHMQYFVQQIQHPAMEVGAVDLAYKRLVNMGVTGNAVVNGTVTMDVLMDENMETYKEIYDWLLRMTDQNHVPASARFQNGKEQTPTSYCDISLSILTSSNNANKEILYRNAFPVSLGDVQFNTTSTGEYIVFPVTFKFDYFTFS